MDGDQIMQQETQEEQVDSFLEGWEETSPEPEEDASAEGGGDQAEPQDTLSGLGPGETWPDQGGRPHMEGPAPVGPGPLTGPSPGPASRAAIQADARAFIAAFPEAVRDFRNIPPEVWAEVNAGSSLTAAYARYAGAREAARLQAQEAARRREWQNARNAAASTGSMKSAGSPQRKDPFLEGWEEG